MRSVELDDDRRRDSLNDRLKGDIGKGGGAKHLGKCLVAVTRIAIFVAPEPALAEHAEEVERRFDAATDKPATGGK